MTISLPQGFRAHVTNVGIKDATDDFTLVVADAPCAAAGLFTQSRFAGPSVLVSREHVADGKALGVVVISKNANVATGEEGMNNAREVVAGVARAIGCNDKEILIASTGVIGRQYPMNKVRAGLAALPAQPQGTSADDVARGIMTTDTVSKVAQCEVTGSGARVVGVAKGVGMIEPNMATLITLIFTDAEISSSDLQTMFQRVIARTFNCVSVDTDTSTSDTAIVLASGKAGKADMAALEHALFDVALSLTKQVARDGEGAEKLIEVCVDNARDYEQAKTVAKAIVNSPLVKTAVHGADPNWGRVAMAVGKCSQYTDIDQASVIIRFGTQEVYPRQIGADDLSTLSTYMKGSDVRIHVALNTGAESAT
ncbi:MAG: bifunctional glutamate N-acetyltransferase/amino-acid acetyltransferase ArgJ, partial [Actinobacteria bacterium]|nr:bifunctional glutamate N-acetyltransferase/amino-acid acetyltransferase ArgJ [Actinomycetota bacterium]